MWDGFSQWNPHMLLKDRLQENLNRRRSLTELMQYLIETVAPLSSLHAFTKIKLQSLRAYSQMLCAESSLPVSLQVSLSACKNFLFCTAVQHILASGVADCYEEACQLLGSWFLAAESMA
uniref:Uncharacterized protein n=1 Tax=Parascaris equorum TaxID=6256 RepID=A0A914RE56_PAREQ